MTAVDIASNRRPDRAGIRPNRSFARLGLQLAAQTSPKRLGEKQILSLRKLRVRIAYRLKAEILRLLSASLGSLRISRADSRSALPSATLRVTPAKVDPSRKSSVQDFGWRLPLGVAFGYAQGSRPQIG